MMDVSELKPCPFCGDPEIWVGRDPIRENPRRVWVECKGCNAFIVGTGELDEVMEHWNRRVSV